MNFLDFFFFLWGGACLIDILLKKLNGFLKYQFFIYIFENCFEISLYIIISQFLGLAYLIQFYT